MVLVAESASSCYFKNCEFNGAGGVLGTNIGFMCKDGPVARLENCIFRNLKFAVYVGCCSTVSMENCTFPGNDVGHALVTTMGATAFVKPSTTTGTLGNMVKDPLSTVVGLT